jgi:hypothetical protein
LLYRSASAIVSPAFPALPIGKFPAFFPARRAA